MLEHRETSWNGAFNYRPTFSGALTVRFQGVEIGDMEPFVDT